MKTAPTKKRTLLVTLTKEPFQPVRLYYAIPTPYFVTRVFKKLHCMVEAPSEGYWQWSFEAEAASIEFPAGGYDDVPREARPIVLGRIHFPRGGGMTLQTNSLERAIAGARFFAPRFGSRVVPMRCRLLNRYCAADEGSPDELIATLDQDPAVIDSREAEANFQREVSEVGGSEDLERAAAAFLQRKLESMEDVPMVEDFPLCPEEETPGFDHLAAALRFRLVRAYEHWHGNTHLTLTAIILRSVEETMRAHPDLG